MLLLHQNRLKRILAVLVLAATTAVGAHAQNECKAGGMQAIAFVGGSDGVVHDALCWDKEAANSCVPNSGSCGVQRPTDEVAAGPAAATPARVVLPNPVSAISTIIASPVSSLDIAKPREVDVPVQRPSASNVTIVERRAPGPLVVGGADGKESKLARITRGAGEAEIALQGYYQSTTGQQTMDTSGMAIALKDFLPGIGLLIANFQGYGSQGDFRLGDNYLRLGGVAMLGQHWSFTGGDFRLPMNVVDNPFNNLYTPEVNARGFEVEIANSHRVARIFGGEETLTEGPRVPFRIPAPQHVFGITLQQRIGERLQIGVRYLHTSSSESDLASNPAFFPPGRRFLSADSLSAQALYRFSKQLKWFAEATLSGADRGADMAASPMPVSFLVGGVWDSAKFTVRANYVSQGSAYMPLAGYYVGDRRGPYAEVRYRVSKGVEFFASGNHYSNNLENDPNVPTYNSSGYSSGVAAALPWKLSASAQISTIDFTSSAVTSTNTSSTQSANQQLSISLSRPVQLHHLRLSLLQLQNRMGTERTQQRLTEVEDLFIWKHLVVGGAARLQSAAGAQGKDTLYFRASARFSVRSLSVYGSMERGNDLVNKSLFATSSVQSTVLGVSTPLFHGWSLQFEAFRNNLTTGLNPGNIFVLGGQGVDVPTVLSSFNQWSAFFRISKQLRWGAVTSAETIEQYTARQVPLVGAVEGMVFQRSLAGIRPAKAVGISLDGSRTTYTDDSGYYRFAEVPEGIHQVGLALDELPADMEPAGVPKSEAKVLARTRQRIDFNVAPLLSISGKLIVPPGVSVENVVVRLQPTEHYTTPDRDGLFSFYNVPEGVYEVVIDRSTLPDGISVTTGERITLQVALDSAAPASAVFQLAIEHHEKPIRRIMEEQISVGAGAGQTGQQ